MNQEPDVNSDPLCLLEQAIAEIPQDSAQLLCAQQFLRDIAVAADEAERTELSRFAAALDGLLELVETQSEGDGANEILDFVRNAVAPLRSAVADEPDANDRVREALETVDEHWGEYLSLVNPSNTPISDDDVWTDALEQPMENPWDGLSDSTGELTPSQTREEVNRLLEALSGSGADDVEPAEFRPARTESERCSTETKSERCSTETDEELTDQRIHEIFGDTDSTFPREPPLPVAIDMGAELLEAYLDDATGGVSRLEQLVLSVENSPNDESLHRSICRELHTLKGASASVGLSDLAAYLHAVEGSIDAANGSAIEITPMLNAVDAVRRQIETLAGRSSSGPVDEEASGSPPAVTAEHKTAGTAPQVSFDMSGPGQEESLRVKASRVDRLMDMLAELVILRNQRDSRLSRLKNLHSELTRCVTRLRVCSDGMDIGLASAERDSLRWNINDPDATAGRPSGQSGSVSEIASDIAEFARSLRELSEPMEAESVTISQFIRQFRMELIEMRRMPISGLFQRLNRVARDAARAENKKIEFQLQGEHAGLDRSLQERLYEPLLHMVRNAVSHGIESAEDRRKAGKRETGTITFSAKGSPTTLIIEISDDGGGLDYEAIRRKALDKGLISADEAVEESRLARLIFHPGFSTKQKTSEISGRGVGMDVVAAALQRIRAKIDVESRRGEGTTMRLTIPLRSVIEHVMVVRVCGRLFAIPMQFVQAARPLENVPSQSGDGTIDDEQVESVILSRNGVRLRTVLGFDNTGLPQREHMLLLGSGRLSFSSEALSKNRTAGQTGHGTGLVLIVDDVVGPDEVVVRSLPSLLKSHPILGGVTLSGAGEIVQLLDGQRLLDYAADFQRGITASESDSQRSPDSATPADDGNKRVLVIDDSLSARRCLVQHLKTLGFEITEASDGVEGIDFFRHGEFRFVFTDLDMPRLDGFGVLSEIKAASPVPVIVVTSRSESEFRDRATEHGADGYLTKPVTESALAELVAELERNLKLTADTRNS